MKLKHTLKLSPLVIAMGMTNVLAQEANETTTTTNNNEQVEVVEVVGSVSRFGATKSNTPILESARSVSIETIESFLEKGALNLSQTTTYMAGVSGETFGFSTRGDWIRIRGLEVPRYRDSIQELFGSYNTTRTEVYTLEQVEVLKGPASVLYGQGSAGGLVNAVSKTPRADAAQEISLQLGNYDRKQLSIDFNGSLNDSESVLGRFVGIYRDSDTQVDNVDDNTLVLMPSITFLPTDDTSITFIGLFQDTQSDIGSQFIPIEGTLTPLADGSYLDQDVYAGEPGFNKFDTESTQFTVLAEHMINDNFSLSGTALWREGEADYNQAWPTFWGDGVSRYLNTLFGATIATDTTVARSFYQADNSSEQAAIDLRLNGDFTTGDFEHEILVGVQYQDVKTDNNSSYYYGGGVLEGDYSYILDLANPVYTGAPDQSVFDAIYYDAPSETVKDTGLYLSDQISIDNWRITLGLRYDNVDNTTAAAPDFGIEESSQSDDAVSFSGGVLYKFDNGLSPYVSYAESFETVVGTDSLTGDALKPQEAEQLEVGLKYEPQSFAGYFTLAYFDIVISNLDSPSALPNAVSQQEGESTLSGIEFEGKFAVGDFDIQLAYATLDAKDPDGFHLAATPDSNGAVWVTWQPAKLLPNFNIGAGVRYVGESVAETSTVNYTTPSYTLGDIMLGYQVSDNLDLALNIRNVTDKQYLTACLTRGDCFPGLRRSVNGSLTYRF
ncbi:TonB-dependent siderophore receptor [Paraglaciecola sp. 2405UD69-4]|uniref:TonB-dependent siderophore receptor n=1 Tax=Paraglaciecola sp. 2405UD69-4 TaxID=3391836 RepID=UPI0039C9CB65